MKRNSHKEHGCFKTSEVLHLLNFEWCISKESFVKYWKDKQTNRICMTASELRQLWPVCQREDIRAGRKQRRRWKTWPEDINHNHQYNRYQLGISYIFEISEFYHHPKTSNVSGTPGNGAEGRKHGHHLENYVAESRRIYIS